MIQSSKYKIDKKLNNFNDTELYVSINYQTDNFGLDLGEIFGSVTALKTYPCGYSKKLIGRNFDISVKQDNDKLK